MRRFACAIQLLLPAKSPISNFVMQKIISLVAQGMPSSSLSRIQHPLNPYENLLMHRRTKTPMPLLSSVLICACTTVLLLMGSASASPLCQADPERFGAFSLTTKLYIPDNPDFQLEFYVELQSQVGRESYPLMMHTTNAATRRALLGGYVRNSFSMFFDSDFKIHSGREQLGVHFGSLHDVEGALQITGVILGTDSQSITTRYIMPNVANIENEVIAWMSDDPEFAYEQWNAGETLTVAFFGEVQGQEVIIASADLPPHGISDLDTIFFGHISELLERYSSGECRAFRHYIDW